jgi:hypothetical protein
VAIGPLTTHSIRASDPEGRSLAGARLTVRSLASGWTTTEIADGDGRWQIQVPDGELQLEATHFLVAVPRSCAPHLRRFRCRSRSR